MSVVNWGLLAFVMVVTVDAAALITDLIVWLLGMPTLTREVRRYPLLGLPVLMLQVVGVVGLAAHLWG